MKNLMQLRVCMGQPKGGKEGRNMCPGKASAAINSLGYPTKISLPKSAAIQARVASFASDPHHIKDLSLCVLNLSDSSPCVGVR